MQLLARGVRPIAGWQHGQVRHGRKEQGNHGHVPGRDRDNGVIFIPYNSRGTSTAVLL